jgi:hypothetical protein
MLRLLLSILAPSGLLFLAGRDPGTLYRVDTASRTVSTHHLEQLSGGDPPYMVAFTGGRLVTFTLGHSWSLAPDLSDPRELGEAWFFVPSATPGRVWNLLLTPGSNVTFRGVREVGVDGRTYLTRRAKVPGWALGAVPRGLVLQRNGLEVWDPVSARVVLRLKGEYPLGFHGPLVASCTQRCNGVHVTDTSTGRETIIARRSLVPYQGAFSPDGRHLAVPTRRGAIALFDVAAGSVRLIAGARMAGSYQELAWASSGWLFYNAGRRRLGAWRPGLPARVLPEKVGPFVDMTSD